MPRKPIKPDRVRPPTEWKCARYVYLGAVMVWVLVFLVGGYFYLLPRGIKLGGWLGLSSFWLVFAGGSFYSLWVRRKWKRRIDDCDGFMCPQCTDPLDGLHEQSTSLTCPECGYITKDTTMLKVRWRQSLVKYFWMYHK